LVAAARAEVQVRSAANFMQASCKLRASFVQQIGWPPRRRAIAADAWRNRGEDAILARAPPSADAVSGATTARGDRQVPAGDSLRTAKACPCVRIARRARQPGCGAAGRPSVIQVPRRYGFCRMLLKSYD